MRDRAEVTILKFVADRHAGTVCPSEIARCLAKEDNVALEWRKLMPVVHEAVDDLSERREITLTWKSLVMERRTGPYRIGTAKRSP